MTYTPTQPLAEISDSSSSARSSALVPRLTSGTYLAGRFKIARWIASGGMGEVYEAFDAALGEWVALKVIRSDIANDTQSMQRFRREVALARQVTHPNVCRLFEFFQHAQAPQDSSSASPQEPIGFLTMEFLDGETLADVLRSGQPMSVEQALPIVRQMAEALDAAHEVGVFHRDFKCSNVMLVEASPDPRAVVTDFGLARSTLCEDPDKERLARGEILGSPAYMAPEQAVGDAPTPAADIYSLGVVTYRMVTGRLPIDSPTPFTLLTRKMQEDPPPPSQVVEHLDPTWDAAILQCLAREPEGRFANGREFITALEAGASTPAKARGRRWPVGVAAVGLATLFTLGMLIQPWRDLPEAQSQSRLDLFSPRASSAQSAQPAVFQTSTPSMPANPRAARLYTAGLEALRAFDVPAARTALLEAVEVAPSFPMAHAALAEADAILGYEVQALEEIRLAYENSHQAQPQERLRIEGQYSELTGAWDDAVQTYRVLFESSPENLEYGLHLAQCQMAAGQADEAAETLRSLRQLPEALADDPRIDDAEFRLAMTNAQYERALSLASQTREKYQHLEATLLAGRAQLDEGYALSKLRRLDEALATTEEAHRTLLNLGDHKGAAQALHLQGLTHFRRGANDASLKSFDAALELFSEIGCRSGRIRVLNSQAMILSRSGRARESLELLEEALQLARAMGVKADLVPSLRNLADTHAVLGNFQEALKLHQETLDVARQIDNPRYLANSLMGVSHFLFAKNPDHARPKLDEALAIYRQCDRRTEQSRALLLLAALDLIQDDLESAHRRLDAVAALDDSQLQGGRIALQFHRAFLAYEEGRHQEAAGIATDLTQRWKDFEKHRSLGHAHGILVLSHLSLSDTEASRRHLEQAMRLQTAVFHQGIDFFLAGAEARLLTAEGRPEEALTLLEDELRRANQAERTDWQLEARFLLGIIERDHVSHKAAVQRLSAVAHDAEAAGFHRIARKAREAFQHQV